MKKIPAFIICRDRVTDLRDMVAYLNQEESGVYPVILDNNSTNPELLEFYATEPCIIHRLTANYGNCSPVFNVPECIPNHIKPDVFVEYDCTDGYIVTDCDLKINHIPITFMDFFRETMEKYSWCMKVGFQLRISDLPNTKLANEAKGWEQNNHSRSGLIDDKRIKAPIDTTFAFYRWLPPPRTWLAHDFDNSIRCVDFEAIHSSWYFSKDNPPPADELYYLEHITSDFNHYSIRLKQMLAE